MDTSRKANREDNEKTLQYQSRQENLLVEELNEDKLTQLLAFISRTRKNAFRSRRASTPNQTLW